MSKLFYRFRSIKSLLGEFEELEKQTIYFAPPEDLNDPMEGFRDIFWSGDEIVWKNLFKHYLLCLEQVSQLLIICGEEHHTITENDIPVFKCYDDFETLQYKELFEKISLEFFDIISPLIEKITTRTTPIRIDELNMYLSEVHFIAIEIIEKNYRENNFLKKRKVVYCKKYKRLESIIKIIDLIEKIVIKKEYEDKVENMCLIQKSMIDNIKLNMYINNNFTINSINKNFVLIDFVDKYIKSTEKLMYPKHYTACFMKENNNSSVWGHYGDSHKGVCLVFEADKDENLSLYGKNGRGRKGTIFGNVNHKFYKVNYKNGFKEINFFKSLGSMPVSKLISVWYTDDKNKLSNIADDMLDNQDKWRERYWANFYKNILIKTKDWKYEKEYRLILSSGLDNETKEKYRTLKYNFNSLKGLIFGIKTSMKDKIKIIKIIKQKCKENKRDNFELYQAYYSHKNKNIQHKKITVMNLGNNENI